MAPSASAQNIQYTSKSADLGLRSDLKINPSTHALELQIPLANYTGRAGTGLPVSLNYSSKVWRMKYAYYQSDITGVAAIYGEHSQGGWTLSLGFPVIDIEPQGERYYAGGGPTGGECRVGGDPASPSDTSTCCYVDRVLVRMPDGSTHELRSTDTPVCFTSGTTTSITPPDNMYAVDGSRLRYRKSTRELFMPDGSRYVFNNGTPGGQYIDRNGNVLSYDGTQWTDTLGRTIAPMSVGDGDYAYTLPGIGNTTIDYTLKWRHLSATGVLSPGEPLSWTTSPSCPAVGSQTHADFLFGGGDGCIVSHYLFDPVVLYQVVLPTGQAYTFNYNRYGEVSKVTYPTGGYERYVYGRVDSVEWVNEPYASANRGVLDRYVSAGGSGVDEAHWQYPTGAPGGFLNGQFQQGEIAPDGTLTERLMYRGGGGGAGFGYSFSEPMGGMPYEERVWSAPDPSDNNNRHLLRRKLTKWEATGSNAAYQPQIPVPAARSGRVAKEVELILDTGGGQALAKVTTYEYNLAYQFTTGANLTAVNEYDYVPVAQSAAQSADVDSFAPPAQWLRRTEYDYLDDVNAAYRDRNLLGLKKETRVKDASGAVVARTVVGYDQYGLEDCPDIINHDVAYGAGFVTRGDPTSVTTYEGAAAMTGAVTATTHYDVAGNAISATDANGNTSYVSYADSYSDGNNGRHTYAFPTGTTTAAPNPSPVPKPSPESGFFNAGTFGSTTGLTSSTVYDFRTGFVTSTADANGQTTAYDYADPLNRLKRVDLPDGGRTTYIYDDRNLCGPMVEMRTLLDDTGREASSWQFFDGLGRLYISELYDGQDASKPYLRTDTVYDAMGRVSQTSSQYRAAGCGGADPSRQWTTTEYDALGRVTKMTTPDGSRVRRAYNGQYVLVADALNKQRVSKSDALGRLTEVWELKAADPQNPDAELESAPSVPAPDVPLVGTGYRTGYTYDALGNLKEVAQGTQPHRFFNYNSFSRLTSAANPESGTVTYTYDPNGNLATRTDARGVISTYTYDHLNRNIITTYSGGGTTTPGVRRFYDGAVNGKGVLSRSEAVGVSASEYLSYDEMGRPTQSRQAFWAGNAWGQWYTVSHSYNKAGGVVTQTYPSGHTVTYNYDAAGRLGDNGTQLAFSGDIGDGVTRTYASEIRYHPFGGMEQERFGTQTPVYDKSLYNTRGQLAEIRVSTYPITAAGHETDWNRGAIINHYSANGWGASGGGPDNNGNLQKQEVYIPHGDGNSTNIVQEYGYDALNRLTSVYDKPSNGTSDFYQLYKYDRWGNRTIDPAGWNAPAPQFSVDAATNRLGVSAGQSGRMDYDAAGNLINDNYSPRSYGSAAGAQTRFYDAENRMTSAQLNSTQTAAYAYDADGQRVKRNTGSGEVWQVYGAGGELIAEYAANASPTQPQKEYGYRNGELLVTASAAIAGWGVAPVLHDNPLVAGETVVQSRHITELRDAINALRAHKGLTAYSWQTNATVGALITAGPISEMRQALDEALGAPSGGYAPGLAQHQPVMAVHIQELRDRVLEAWQTGGSVSDVRWLVNDQLGTPRMIIDQTGSLAGVTRHDYMPFGEEVEAGGNWRTTLRGYGADDKVRQQFTGKERDDETGLDYFDARYFSSAMGRFTSPDEFRGGPDELYDFADDASDNPTFYADLTNPQSLNKYQYAYNNPLRYVDPDGHAAQDGPELLDHISWPPMPQCYGCSYEERYKLVEQWKEATRQIDEANRKIDEENERRVREFNAPHFERYKEEQPPLGIIKETPESKDSKGGGKDRTRKAAPKEPTPQLPRSTRRIGDRTHHNTKKKAEDAARREGDGRPPINHPRDPHGPHFHPNVPENDPRHHNHHFYPRHRRAPADSGKRRA